jgi:hypothetical protein
MSYLVTGTRERFYPARTPAEVSDQEEQEAEAHAHGWVPLTSEREADGTLRVLYGRLAGAPDGEAGPEVAAPEDRGQRAAWRLAVILALCVLVTIFALFARQM